MDKVDFYEQHSAVVRCPNCHTSLVLTLRSALYCEDEGVTCRCCWERFLLGKPLSEPGGLNVR